MELAYTAWGTKTCWREGERERSRERERVSEIGREESFFFLSTVTGGVRMRQTFLFESLKYEIQLGSEFPQKR